MTEAKVLQLLTHLAESAFLTDSKSALDKAMLARDGFVFCLLWQTGMRGLNAAETTLDDFMLPGLSRGSLKAYLISISSTAWQSQHPGTIEVHPLKTKTHAVDPYSISLPRASSPEPTICWMCGSGCWQSTSTQPWQADPSSSTSLGPPSPVIKHWSSHSAAADCTTG